MMLFLHLSQRTFGEFVFIEPNKRFVDTENNNDIILERTVVIRIICIIVKYGKSV